MAPATRAARWLTLSAYFVLLAYLLLWLTWLAPSEHFPTALVLLVMVTPLLIPLRGLLAGKPYTHGWFSMMILFYFAWCVMQAWAVEAEQLWGSIGVALTVVLFVGLVMFARLRGRELKQRPDDKPPAT